MDIENITLKYPGSINNFRSLMDGLLEGFDRKWKYLDNKYLTFRYRADLRAPGREVWHVLSGIVENDTFVQLPSTGATILAYEGMTDKTDVSFLDGKLLHLSGQKQDFNDPGTTYPQEVEKIGEGLMLFSKELERQWRIESSTNIPQIARLPMSTFAQIDAIEYSGSVAHFRAWMDRFFATNGQICTLRKGTTEEAEYKVVYYTPAKAEAREVWNVFPIINGKDEGRRYAMILATESPNGVTVIDFLDGKCYERTGYGYRSPAAPPIPQPVLSDAHLASHDSIGDDFIQVAKEIREHFEKDNQEYKETRFLQEPQSPQTETRKEVSEINLQTKPAGRKVDPWNPIAYEILTDGKENAELRAFEYWCEEQGYDNPGKAERDAFKKAMKRAEQRARRNR